MTSLRGFVFAIYTADDGSLYSLQVQRNYAIDPVLGFVEATDPYPPLLPRRWKPRRAWGVSPTTGRRNSAIVGSVTAPLWLGSAAGGVDVFQRETDNGSSDDFQVTRRRGEQPFIAGPRPALP